MKKAEHLNGIQKQPPGPGGLPFIGQMRRAMSNPLEFTLFLTREYGDISRYRIGPFKGYLLNHPEYFRHVLNHNHQNYTKDNYNYRLLKPVIGNGLITSEGEVWRRHRRMIQPAFHAKQAHVFANATSEIAEAMLDEWDRHAGNGDPVDVSKEMMKLTLAVVTRALFGSSIDKLADAFGRAFNEINANISWHLKTGYILPRWTPTPGNLRFRQSKKVLERIVRDIIRQRRIGERRDDLLEMLISARDEDTGQALTDKEIRDEVMTLILAGHETTANLLSWTCYLLARHPEIEQRMRSEILQESGKNAVRKGEIPQFQFTRNVLQEVLRLYPPVWIISRKAIEEDSIGGYRIPAGAIVTLSSYALHRHPVFWENPEEFIPGRFSNVKGKLKSDAYFPFGGGPRSCIGSHFAMTEALQAISMIYARFHLRIAGEIEVEPEPLVTLRPRDGLRMVPVRI